MRGHKTTALLMTAAALAASSPEASASLEKVPASGNICKTANQNKSNRLLHKLASQITNKVVNFRSEWVKIQDSGSISVSSTVKSPGVSTKKITIDSGESSVTGSNGEYNLEVSSVDIGSNDRLDVSDVNRVKVSEGSDEDGRPLFAMTVQHMQKRWTDGPRDNNCWYSAQGTAIMPSGERASFNGTTSTMYSNQPEIFLDSQETAATGTVMTDIVNNALSVQPTHLIEPPIKELQ